MLDSTATRRRCLESVTRRAGNLGLLTLCLLFSGCGLLITPQHRIAVARKEMKAGEWQAAAAELRTVLQGHPNDSEAWQVLAEVSFGAGDINGAESSLKHAMAAGARGADVDALRLRVWLAAGQPQAVIAAIAGHTVHPGEPTRSLDLARADVAAGRAAEGVAILQPLLAAHPGLTQGRVAMAGALADQGQLDPALQELDTALQRDPKSVRASLLKGRILASRGEYSAAERALTAALARMPPAQPLLDRAGALVALTEAQLAQGKVAAAAKSQAALAAMVPGAPVVQLLAGRIDLARGNLTAGVNQLERVVARAPGFVAARLYLGAAELAEGNLQQSQQQLEQVVQAEPDNIQARKLLATVRLRLGEPEAALSALTPALESQPGDPGLLYLLGAAGRRGGNSKPALQALERKLQADSKDQTGAALDLARVQAATGDLGAARSTLSTALAAHPEALPVRIALAEVLVRAKALPQALALVRAADKPGSGPEIKLDIARIQLLQGDVKDAQATLDQAVAAQTQPGQAPVAAAAGALLFAANQYSAALARFALATRLAPNVAVYWLDSARAQLALNQSAAGRESLLKAARIRPNWPPVVGMLAFMDLHAGKGPAALARVNALVASERNDAPALAMKGYVEAALGDTGAAMAAYMRAQALHPTAQVAVQLFRVRLAGHEAHPEKPLENWLAREPGDWRIHEVLGEYYLGIRDLQPAERQLEAVVRQSPDNILALNNLAWIYSKLGDPRAEATAERAYKLAPQAPQIDDTLGWILARGHEAARAVALLARAAKLTPGDPEVEYHYAYALFNSGKRDEAKRLLSKLLSTSRPFESRAAAVRLLAATKAT